MPKVISPRSPAAGGGSTPTRSRSSRRASALRPRSPTSSCRGHRRRRGPARGCEQATRTLRWEVRHGTILPPPSAPCPGRLPPGRLGVRPATQGLDRAAPSSQPWPIRPPGPFQQALPDEHPRGAARGSGGPSSGTRSPRGAVMMLKHDTRAGRRRLRRPQACRRALLLDALAGRSDRRVQRLTMSTETCPSC